MSSRAALPLLALLLAVIAGLHAVATERHWYWTLPWFDVVLHLLAGFWVAAGALWVAYRWRGWSARARPRAALLLGLGAGLAAGLSWELYEYLTGRVYVALGGYLSDTLLDLAMDLAGAGAAVLLLFLLERRRTPLAAPVPGS